MISIKSTSVMDHTHGPLGFQRLSFLTIGSEGLVISLRTHCRPREDRGEEPPCVCVFVSLIRKVLVEVLTTGGYSV